MSVSWTCDSEAPSCVGDLRQAGQVQVGRQRPERGEHAEDDQQRRAARRGRRGRPGEATIRCGAVPSLKPAYLIHGDDHGRIAERRANLRALGEREGGAAGVDVLTGDDRRPRPPRRRWRR